MLATRPERAGNHAGEVMMAKGSTNVDDTPKDLSFLLSLAGSRESGRTG